MLKVDTTTCVVCGKKEYTRSVGKSARSMNGVCKEHASLIGSANALEDDDAQTAIPGTESKGVSKGNKS